MTLHRPIICRGLLAFVFLISSHQPQASIFSKIRSFCSGFGRIIGFKSQSENSPSTSRSFKRADTLAELANLEDTPPHVRDFLLLLDEQTYNARKDERYANAAVGSDAIDPLKRILAQPIQRIEFRQMMHQDPFLHPNVYEAIFHHPDGRVSVYQTMKRLEGPYDYIIGGADMRKVRNFVYISEGEENGIAWSNTRYDTPEIVETDASAASQLLSMVQEGVDGGQVRVLLSKTFEVKSEIPTADTPPN